MIVLRARDRRKSRCAALPLPLLLLLLLAWCVAATVGAAAAEEVRQYCRQTPSALAPHLRAQPHGWCARAAQSNAAQQEAPPLALEAANASEPGVQPLRLGERVALTELGPVVVNADCTLRRIANWAEKLPHEREATQRRVAARNALRLEACRQLEADGKLLEGVGGYRDADGGEGGAEEKARERDDELR